MTHPAHIPVFTLFGETGRFPDVVHCERIADRASNHGWTITAHRHAQMSQLFVIEDGGVAARIDGDAIALRSGQFLYVPAQTVHAFDFRPDTSGRVLSFPATILNTIGPQTPDILQALSRPFTGAITGPLGALVGLLADTLSGVGGFRTQAAVALAHAILALLADTARGGTDDGRLPQAAARLARLDAMIAEYIADGWTASDYARALSVSTGHLSRLCRAASGFGAQAYIERARIEEACRLLAFTRLPVAEVGYRLGFNDPSYFSKRFNAIRGETPSEYRQQFVN